MARCTFLFVSMVASLVLAHPASGLDPSRSLNQYLHEVWQAGQGLPHNAVYSIAQTRDGYLWLGTEEGLARFDGVRFTVFDERNTPELANHWIQTLLVEPDGNLLIGMYGGGLARLQDGKFSAAVKQSDRPGKFVRTVLRDSQGTLWVGSEDDGLNKLKDGRLTPVSLQRGPASPRVYSLRQTRDGSIWIGTQGSGLYRLKDGKLTSVSTKDGLPSDRVQPLIEDRAGNLWIGTDAGLSRLKNGQIMSYSKKDGLSDDRVLSLLEDRAGNLWVGTGGGLDRLKDGTFTSFSTRAGLTGEAIHSLFEDREGSLWIGTGGGLNRLRDGKVTTLSATDGLPSDNVNSILEDSQGSLWITSNDAGLTRLKDGVFTVFSTKDGLTSNHLSAIHEDHEGNLWIGTIGSGVDRLKDGTVTNFSKKDGLSDDTISCIQDDRQGNLWIGTVEGGLNRLKDGQITTLTTTDGLASNRVLVLYEDREGTLWIGTDGGGLSRLKDGELTVLAIEDGLASNKIRTLHEDAEGTLWIGTYGGGLSRLKDGRVTSFTTKDGLLDDRIFRILEDGQDNLWMSSMKGIFRVGKKDLTGASSGKERRISTLAFGTTEGMPITECSGGAQPAGWRTRDGRLFFPTIKGVVVIDPAHLPMNQLAPSVVLEEVLAGGRRVEHRRGKSPVRFPPRAERIEFHYTAPSFLVPSRVRFKYRLEGFDSDWVEGGTNRSAHYTNLSPRGYTFRVIACNDDGVWNEEGAALSFTLQPRFFQTWWFYGLVALGFVGVGVGAQRIQVMQLKAQRAELSRSMDERAKSLADRTRNLEEEKSNSVRALAEAEASRKAEIAAVLEADVQKEKAETATRAKNAFLTNMSHELRTPLHAVLGFSQLMARRNGRDEEDLEHLAIIGRSGEHLLGIIEDVLSLSRIEAGVISLSAIPFELLRMLDGLGSMLRVRAEAKGLDLVLEFDGSLPAIVVGDAGKLRQILLNLLSNAVKFTANGRVIFRARWSGGRAFFEVEDAGPGMTTAEMTTLFQAFVQTETGRKSAEGTGLGLAISRSFARQMGGEITVVSEQGKGTIFRVVLPLPEADEAAVASVRGDRRPVIGLAKGETARRILVVDDVFENRLLLSRLLSSLGFQVTEAIDGLDAVEQWKTGRPELIFMDVRMPVMDGLTATKRIREAEEGPDGAEPGTRVKIVALSASALPTEQEDILKAGCDAFLAKPIREGAIFERLTTLLGVQFEREEFPAPKSTSQSAPPTANGPGSSGSQN